MSGIRIDREVMHQLARRASRGYLKPEGLGTAMDNQIDAACAKIIEATAARSTTSPVVVISCDEKL